MVFFAFFPSRPASARQMPRSPRGSFGKRRRPRQAAAAGEVKGALLWQKKKTMGTDVFWFMLLSCFLVGLCLELLWFMFGLVVNYVGQNRPKRPSLTYGIHQHPTVLA